MEDREQRLKEVAAIAVALEAQTGCPAQLLIAQWALESEWGAKPAGHANYLRDQEEQTATSSAAP